MTALPLHFHPHRGWMNDPVGVVWDGHRYHLFFQYVPDSAKWQPACRWGHAVSPDLVSWTETGVAIEPAPDETGAWSGSLVIDDDGTPSIFYSSVQAPSLDLSRIRKASPLDKEWARWEPGPLVAETPPGHEITMFRDPFVFRDGDIWRMLVGASVDGAGALTSFTSADLENWQFDTVLTAKEIGPTPRPWTGHGWECPQLLRFPGHDVLLVSVWEAEKLHYIAAAIGTFVDGRFTADRWQRLTFGDSYYAGTTFLDEHNRRCIIYWLRGVSADDASWTGALSVPHILDFEGDNLVARPHPTLRRMTNVPPQTKSVGARLSSSKPAAASSDLDHSAQIGQLRLSGDQELRQLIESDNCAEVLIDDQVVEVWTKSGSYSGSAAVTDESATRRARWSTCSGRTGSSYTAHRRW